MYFSVIALKLASLTNSNHYNETVGDGVGNRTHLNPDHYGLITSIVIPKSGRIYTLQVGASVHRNNQDFLGRILTKTGMVCQQLLIGSDDFSKKLYIIILQQYLYRLSYAWNKLSWSSTIEKL